MYKKSNAEYIFTKEINENQKIGLIVSIDYGNKTYEIFQENQEGIMTGNHKDETVTNKAYMQLAIEALEFIEEELYTNK